MDTNGCLSLQNVQGEGMILDPKFKVHLQKAVEYNSKGKPFDLSGSRQSTKKKSKNFSKISKQRQQKVVSKITRSFTTPPNFKKRHFSKPFFRKKTSKKAILKNTVNSVRRGTL